MTKRDAAHDWIEGHFNFIPFSVFKRLANYDKDILNYCSSVLQLIGAEVDEDGVFVLPEMLWDTLFNPKEIIDDLWIREHLDYTVACGLYVFDSNDFGLLLGIDGGGYDFYTDHWIPLYTARGFQWHVEE